MIKLRTILLSDKLYIALTIIAVIYSLFMMNIYKYKSVYKKTDHMINGYVECLAIDGNKVNILLKGKEKVIVNYFFESEPEKATFHLDLGDYIQITGDIKEPRYATVFNLFDYRDYLYHNQIYYLFSAKKIDLVESNHRLRYRIKQWLIDRIDNIPKSSAYVKALVMGNDDYFNEKVNDSYQFNGISHLFAISGSHITFLSIIILWLLKKLKCEENKRYYLVILFLFFYMFLTDYAGSVLRAVIFFMFISINKMYYFQVKTINILQLTLFALLLVKPGLLYDVGFQFSFLISLYLIKHQSMINAKHNYLKQTFIISFIAFLVSIPICINNFYQINLLSPFLNVFFVPFVTIALFPLSFICLIFPFIDSVLFFFINLLENISLFCSNITIGQIILSKPSVLIIILYYFVITVSLNQISHKKYYGCILLSVILFIHTNVNLIQSKPYIVFLDVGQGDCTLISLPHNKGTILIDTGGALNYEKEWQRKRKTYGIAKDTIIPFLKSVGIKQLDYLFLTHGDADHMGESLSLVSNFKVKKVILNGGSLVSLEKSLIKDLKAFHIPYQLGFSGNDIKVSDYHIRILNPISDIDENSNSLVLSMNINNQNILLMGDAPIKIENKLLNEYSFLNVDILKLGHHGSITSTSEAFLDALNPKYGVIQVGLNNRFNHPSPIVLQRLVKRKIKFFQTSIDGSIKFTIGANDVTVKTALS